jgi:hypothetical protein
MATTKKNTQYDPEDLDEDGNLADGLEYDDDGLTPDDHQFYQDALDRADADDDEFSGQLLDAANADEELPAGAPWKQVPPSFPDNREVKSSQAPVPPAAQTSAKNEAAYRRLLGG